MKLALRAGDGGTVIPLRVNPRAGRTEVGGERAGALCVSVPEAPEKGRATEAALEAVAAALGLAKSAVRLVAGAASRNKAVWVPLGREAVASRLGAGET
jgi:hypothetical protein